jgi:hypothetical protein
MDTSKRKNAPAPSAFLAAAEEAFGFLTARGFAVATRESSPTGAGLLFIGTNVGVEIGLDRRDAYVSCYLVRVLSGRVVRNDEPGGCWAHLDAFLVNYRKYRGSLAEFRPKGDDREWYELDLEMYAAALQRLAPDVVEDSERVFDGVRSVP